MEMVTLPTGIQLGYEVAGDGDRPVLLAGGSGMPPVAWELSGLVEDLVGSGHRVVSFAARGVRPSDAPLPPYSMVELADDAAGLLEFLDVSGCTVIGYSMGGFMAELLTRTRPDLVSAAVLLASAGPMSALDRALLELGKDLVADLARLPASFGRCADLVTNLPASVFRDDPRQVEEWWQMLSVLPECWTSPRGEVGQFTAMAEWLEDPQRMDRLEEIEAPVLVACFEHDLLFPPPGGRQAAAKLPRGEFVEIPGAAHGGLITHGQRCRSPISAFLERQHSVTVLTGSPDDV